MKIFRVRAGCAATSEQWILGLPRVVHLALAVVLFALIALFLALSFYAWPSAADDLCMAAYFEKEGVFGGLYGRYMQWTGGYTSTFLTGAVPQLGDYYAFYKYLPLTVLLLTVWVSTAFSRVVLCLQTPAAWHWLLGLGFTLLFLSGMPMVAAGFYWFTGAATYQVANILLMAMLLLFGRLIQSYGQALTSRGKDFVLLGVCMTAGVGTTETVLILLYVVATIMFCWRLHAERDDGQAVLVWLGLLLLLNLCTAAVLVAPGNLVRSGVEGSRQLNHTMLMDAIRSSFHYLTTRFLEKWLSMSQLWWATLISIAVVLRDKQTGGTLPTVHGAHVLLGLMFCLLIPCVLQWPSLLFLENRAVERTENSILFAFLVCWFITVALSVFWVLGKWVLVVKKLASRMPARRAIPMVVYLLALIGFVVGIASTTNIQTAFNDLINVAPGYDTHMQARLAKLEEVRGTGVRISLSQYPTPPTTIAWAGLDIVSSDGNIDFRHCLAEYFRVTPVIQERVE